jgi:gliding motility-associated-like protein
MKKKFNNIFFIYIILCLFQSQDLFSQYFINPSFEDIPGISQSPAGWSAFDSQSTPDTEPILCDDSFGAFDGNTFMTLVTRGPDTSLPGSTESCITELKTMLEKDRCYQLSIFLANRNDVGFFTWENGFTSYDAPTRLMIYGSNSLMETGTLLITSDPVDHPNWQEYRFRFKAGDAFRFLILQAEFSDSQILNGNIAIDLIELIAEEITTEIKMDQSFSDAQFPVSLTASEGTSYSWYPGEGLSCTNCQTTQVSLVDSASYTCIISDEIGCISTEQFIIRSINDTITDPPDDTIILPPVNQEQFFIPNVFTPNFDGINDYFEIEGLKPFSSIMIFNSIGRMVFQSEDYQSNWDGTDLDGKALPEGTYWYIIVEPGFANKKKGYIYIKR